MKNSLYVGALTITAMASFTGTHSVAQSFSSDLKGLLDAREVTVNVDNFVRAATDVEIGKYLAFSGGVNEVFHMREPTPVDQQPTIRMNRDTLYSMAIIDITDGATVSLPEAGERYISAHIINQDHYMDVYSGGGTYAIDMDKYETPFVVLIVRLLVDSADAEDVAEVQKLQDEIQVTAGSAKPFIMPNYDEESFEAVLEAALSLAAHVPDSRATFGMRDEVDDVRHFLGTAFGWGGLPSSEAFYLNVEPNLPVGEYKISVPRDVPVDAFWSVSLYNERGFFEPNAFDAYNVNSVTGTREDDGSMVVHLGGCGDGRPNCLPIMEGWNYAVRLYQPHDEVTDGSWEFPSVEPFDP